MSKREMMMSKREMMRERMAQMGYDEDYFNDVAFAIVQGSDYDEECQRVTDEIAERMGIVNPDPEYCEWDGTDYGLINELVNELTTLGIELLRA